jgi:hypothetical protein
MALTLVELRGCRFTLTVARRTRVIVFATGGGPVRGEIGFVLLQSNGGDHEVSHLIKTVFADGW